MVGSYLKRIPARFPEIPTPFLAGCFEVILPHHETLRCGERNRGFLMEFRFTTWKVDSMV